MKNQFQISLLCFSLCSLILIIAQGCCKEKCNDPSNPACENYNPCYNFKAANADFSINEFLDLGDNDTMYSETDTILNINPVVFQPRNANQKITWIIGSERLEQKSLYRQNFPLGWIDVTMIAEIDKSNCSINKKLIDTVQKRFYVQLYTSNDSNTVKKLKLFGTWQGYNTDKSSDLFKISFGYIRAVFGAPVKYAAELDLAGLPKGCPSQYDFYQNKMSVMSQVLYSTGFRSQLIKSDGSHSEEGGFNILAKCRVLNKILHIDYSYNDRPYQNYLKKEKQIVEPIITVTKKWTGTKISEKVTPL
jgi:hypothetical protein